MGAGRDLDRLPDPVQLPVRRARDERLAYLAVHNHSGTTSVGFSSDDMASHARGYPALLDIVRGLPVCALVLARESIAGELWIRAGEVVELAEAQAVGPRIRRFYPAPPAPGQPVSDVFDRQARMFGEAGQALLAGARVGILGAGGAGMLLVEYLARLGVGDLIVVDPDRVSDTNLPRLPGARRADVWGPFGRRLGRLLRIRSSLKVRLAERLAREANPDIKFHALAGDIADPALAAQLRDVDYLFCAADSARARLVFNALVHQYGIPGVQVGAKVSSDRASGKLSDVRSVVRPVRPGFGCLWCNGLISPALLANQLLAPGEQAAQRYVDDPAITAPAVITLNAVAASLAANDFLFALTGTAGRGLAGYVTVDHLRGRFTMEEPRRDPECPECGHGTASRLARGDAVALPTMAPRQRLGFPLLSWRPPVG